MSKQKYYRKYAITTMAAAAAVASVAPITASADADAQFPDVKEGDKGFSAVGVHYESIMALSAQDIIKGNEDGNFNPWSNVYRGQVAQMIAKAQDLDIPSDIDKALSDYEDVTSKDDHAKYIAAVTEAGIFDGSKDNKFHEYDYLTREQMASVLVRAFDLEDIDTSKDVEVSFKDVDEKHQDAVQILANLEITDALDYYRPFEQITRAAFSTLLYNTMGVIEDHEDDGELTDKIREAVNDVKSIENLADILKTVEIYQDLSDDEKEEALDNIWEIIDGGDSFDSIDDIQNIIEAAGEAPTKSSIVITSSVQVEGDATFEIEGNEYTASVASEKTDDGDYELKMTFDNVKDDDGKEAAFDTAELEETFQIEVNDSTYTVVKEDNGEWTLMIHEDGEVEFMSGEQVKTVQGDQSNKANPYGAFGPRLDFGIKKLGDMKAMSVSVLKDGNPLATNIFNVDQATNLKDNTTVTPYFNLGTEETDVVNWIRGAYAENDIDNLENYIPDQVEVVYVINDVIYTTTLDITDELELP